MQEGSDLFCLFIQYLVLFWSYWKSDLLWSFAISRKAEMIDVFSLAKKGKMPLTAHLFLLYRKTSLVWEKLLDIFKELFKLNST